MHVELTREFRFESAHRLPMVPPDHKCFRMHGHSYRIEVQVAGPIDPATGWLIDFGEIAARVEPILKAELDHRVLNDVPGLENPTAELLAAAQAAARADDRVAALLEGATVRKVIAVPGRLVNFVVG